MPADAARALAPAAQPRRRGARARRWRGEVASAKGRARRVCFVAGGRNRYRRYASDAHNVIAAQSRRATPRAQPGGEHAARRLSPAASCRMSARPHASRNRRHRDMPPAVTSARHAEQMVGCADESTVLLFAFQQPVFAPGAAGRSHGAVQHVPQNAAVHGLPSYRPIRRLPGRQIDMLRERRLLPTAVWGQVTCKP